MNSHTNSVFSACRLCLASWVALCVACGPSASPSSGTAVAPAPAPVASNDESVAPTVLVKTSEDVASTPAPGPEPVVAEPKRSLLLGALSGPSSEVFGGTVGVGPSPISVSLAVTKISGGLDKDEAERILRLAQDAIRDCASTDQRGSHEFTMTFRVSPKGALSKAKVAGTDSPARGCVSKVLGRLVFPDARKASAVAAKLDIQNSTAMVGVLTAGYGQTGGMALGHRGPSPAGGIRLAQFKSVGPLNGAIIRRILRSKKPRLELCYQRWSMHTSSINNRVTMEFLVKPDGNVGQLKVKAPIRPIEQCIRSVMNIARFPAIASGATRVVHSITLTPRVTKP